MSAAGSRSQRLMDLAEVVMGEVQRYRMGMLLKLISLFERF